jgi:hypothetical protein
LSVVEGTRIALDQGDMRGAARGGLEAEHAAAGEEVQAGQAGQILPQPVEQRLAHGIRRRAQAGHRVMKGDEAAFPLAADDADPGHGSQSPATITVTKCSGFTCRANAARISAADTASTLRGKLVEVTRAADHRNR